MLLLGWPEPELKAGCRAGEGVVIGKGLRGRGGWGVLAPLWMALIFLDRWCRSNDSSSTLAFWPACILNSLTDWLFRFNWKGFTSICTSPLFPPNQPIVLIQPAVSEVVGESKRVQSLSLWRLIIFDDFLLKDWFNLGGVEEGKPLPKWGLWFYLCGVSPPVILVKT